MVLATYSGQADQSIAPSAEGGELGLLKAEANQSINLSKRLTSYANGRPNSGHQHKAPDHNHEATQTMVDLPTHELLYST